MTVSGVMRWLKLAVLALEIILRLLRSLPRLRKEAREAVSAAGLAYREAWEALADRSLTREEVAEVRRKLEAFGKETEDVLKLLALGGPGSLRPLRCPEVHRQCGHQADGLRRLGR